MNGQCSSTLDQRRSWSVEKDKNRISQIDYSKDWSNNVKKAEVYYVSIGQYQSSLGLLGKNHEYTEFIK